MENEIYAVLSFLLGVGAFLLVACLLLIAPILIYFKLKGISAVLESLEMRIQKLQFMQEDRSAAPPRAPVRTATPEAAFRVSAPPPPAQVRAETPPPSAPSVPEEPEKPVSAPPPAPVPSPAPSPAPAAAAAFAPFASDAAPAAPAAEKPENKGTLSSIWRWICVGEEYNLPGVSAEYAVATTWLVRVGAVVLLFGIGFFLKYSIDHNWVNPAVRVISMLISGLAMAFVGIRYSGGKYRAFHLALTGAGFVTLYLSVMAAFSLYHLVEATPAFAVMALITAGAMAAAVGVDGLLIALIGGAGGYLTPVFINTGSKNLTLLLAYFAVITAGNVFVAMRRSWTLSYLVSLIFYVILAGGACDRIAGDRELAVIGLLSLNYLLFTLPPLMRAGRKNGVVLFDLLILLGNAAFYLGQTVPLAEDFHEFKLPALVALYAAIVAAAEAYFVHRRTPENRLLKNFLLVVFAFAMSMVMALYFDGEWICFAWSVMAFLLIFSGVRNESALFLTLGTILFFCNFFQILAVTEGNDTFLERLPSQGAFFLCLALSAAAMKRDVRTWVREALCAVFTVAAAVYFFFYSTNEMHDFLRAELPGFRNGGVSVWWGLLAALTLLCGILRNVKALRLGAMLLFLLCAVKVFFFDLHRLDQLYRIVAFVAVGVLMLTGALLYMRFKPASAGEKKEEEK